MEPMTRLVVVALLAVLGLGAAPADRPTREEDKLLLEVAKRMLQNQKQHQAQWSAYTCAWSVTGSMDETLVRLEDLRPLSPWLLRELRQYQRDLRQCTDTTIEGNFGGTDVVLFLGPVEWEKPSRDASVGCGIGHPTAGRACYSAHRGFLGLWKLTGVIRL
jgi:hypothetical protein